jgi:L-ribulose-5-phosphate 3-epimerase
MELTRRNFLKQTALGSAGLAALLQLKASGAVNIRLSACDWSLGARSDPKGFEIAKEIGLDGLEISPTADVGDTMKIADPAWRQVYKDAAQHTGLVISSVAMGHLNSYPFATDERAPAWLEQTIAATADLGAKVILLAFFSDGDLLEKKKLLGRGGGLKEKEVDAVVDRLIKAAPIAKDAGVIIGLENTLSAEQNLSIINRVNHESVQVYYDVGNSTYNGYDVPAEIRQLDKKICQIHFKDGGFYLGKGKVDMEAVAQAMNDINYDGWVVLETAVQENDLVGTFTKNAAFARNMF